MLLADKRILVTGVLNDASIAFGVLMIYYPLAGALAIVWLISAYAIVFGILMIAFALRLRSHMQTPAAPATS